MTVNLKIIFLISISMILCLSFTTFANPDSFNQASMLEEKVNSGDLPSLENRLPEDVFIVEPIDEIGNYGGKLRTAGMSPEGDGDDQMFSPPPTFVQPRVTEDGFEMVPHLVNKIESSEDKRIWTFHLRKGLKFSDGHSATAEDLMFWYEDVLQNEQLTPTIGWTWKANDELMKMDKIDDYTVKIQFDAPKPLFLNQLYHYTIGWGMTLLPKHYLKQFHPKYTDEEELDLKVNEAGFDNWYELFLDKRNTQYGIPLNEDLPTLSPYVLVKKESDRRLVERNPYYWKVDSEGNQLPYIDEIENRLVSDKEVYQGKILSGELDFAGFTTSLSNYPMYKNYEEDGGYNTILWKSGKSTDSAIMVNLTHEDPELRKIFQNVNFRIALSLALDREEFNEAFYFGKAEPRQHTVIEESKFFKSEFAEAYIDFNPEKANRLLDEMGLDKKDNSGKRLRPDGEILTFTIEYFPIATLESSMVELAAQQWSENLNIQVKTKQISGELASQRAPSNLMDATAWVGGGMTDILWPQRPKMEVPIPPGWERTIWPEWGRWFQTDGEKGEEPPEEIKKLYNWWVDLRKEPQEKKRIELGRKILQMQAENLWAIATVGKTPHPIIANKNLGNVPQDGLWCYDTLWFMYQNPEQIFFKE